MYYGLYTSAAGAHAQSQRVEVLSNNLANVDTVGFKRELALLESRESEAIERGQDFVGSGSLNGVGGGVRMRETATDFSLGVLKPTGVNTDFCIDVPNAFFVAQRGDQELLTRAGNFSMSNSGELLTQEGDAVLDSGSSPIQLDPELPWRLLPGGMIQQGGEQIAIGLRQVANPDLLAKVGQNYFRGDAKNISPLPDDQRHVTSGMLEMSGVNPMSEMVDLIAASRGYETNIKMIQHHDGMQGTLVSRMLRAS
jgi:flagellar basal-body rod protein FlgF/flagellar basal-body rod protein FlgG